MAARRKKKKTKVSKKKTSKKKATKKKKTKKKTSKKAASKKKKTKKKKTKKKANAAFMKPLVPSDILATIVGKKPLPRTQVTKKLWAYIKKNKLQDQIQRQFIKADTNLKKLFAGKNRVSMFEMTKYVSKHLK